MSAEEDYRKLVLKLADAESENARLRAALEEIAKGEGAFSRDRLEHATNVIENAIELAKEALRSKA